MELWFSEYQSQHTKFSFRVKEFLCSKQTEYQNLAVFDTEDYGRVLMLDSLVQLTTRDEFVYHEMITHVPLFTHRNPKKVLIIGGGDGGALREVLKHPIEQADLVDIDKEVTEASKKYFPTLSCSFQDPRANVYHEDGIEFIKNHKGYDIIIVDSTDPIGPAKGLFARDFYQSIFDALNHDGIMVAQTESPLFFGDVIKKAYKDISSVFKYTNLYNVVIPTYPGALWTFTMGSKTVDPLKKDINEIPEIDTKYYSKCMHKSCFVLPPFVGDLIK